MDEGAPALGVGFEIDTASAFGNLATLDDAIGKAAADAVRDFHKIEQASKGAVQLAGATAEVKSFGNAYEREMQIAARSTRQVESATEGMIKRLARQAETLGMTAAQARAFRAEQQAVVAESRGLTEAASRLRAVSSEMVQFDRANGALRKSGKLASHDMLNLAYNFQDLGVQMLAAAGSSNPMKMALMALMQQGSQVSGVMMSAGVGIRAVGAAFLSMSKSILVATATNPYLLAGAAAITVFAGAVKYLQSVANDQVDMKKYAEGLGLTAKEMRQLDSVTVTWGDTAKAVFQVAGRAIWSEIGPAVHSTWETMKDWALWIFSGGKAAANFLIGSFVGGYRTIKATWAMLPDAMKDIFFSAVNSAIEAINSLIRKTVDGINGFISAANTVLGQLGLQLPTISAPQLEAVKNDYAGKAKDVGKVWRDTMQSAMGTDYVGNLGKSVGGAIVDQAVKNARGRVREQAEKKGYLDPEKGKSDKRAEQLGREAAATEALIAGLYKLADAYGVSDAAAMKAEITAKAQEQGIRKQADVAAYVAQQLRKATAEQVVASAKAASDLEYSARAQRFVNDAVVAGKLNIEDASIALANMAQQRSLLATISVAQANNDVQGYQAATAALQKLTAAQIAQNAEVKRGQDIARSEAIKDQMKDVELETRLTRELGEARLAAMRTMGGQRLDDALTDIATAHAKAAIQVKAEAEAARELARGYTDTAQAILAKAEADKTQVDVAARIDRENAGLQRQLDIVSSLTANGPLSGLMGALSSNNPIAGIANLGPLGSLATLATKDGRAAYQKQGQIIADNIAEVFKVSGPFAKTMASLLQGSSLGSTVGSIMGGGKNAQIGSAIGGALGEVAGKKILSSLGSFAGPIGGIVGGLLGGVLGGLIGKPPPPSGTATITNGNIGISGTDSSRKQAAGQMANSVTGGLSQIAKALGATIGNYNVALGQYKDEFRVNFSGSDIHGVKKTAAQADRQTYSTAEAAVRAALADAIKDGAIQGISASKSAILKAGTDIDTQLDRVMQFQNVFDEVKKKTDPLGFAMDQLAAQETNLREIFKQASATTAEYAKLEQYLADQRQAALDEDAQRQLEKLNARRQLEARLMTAQGDATGALALSRQIELSQTDAALRALMQQVYAAEDAQQATTAAAQAADELTKAWQSVGDSIMDEVKRIRGLSDTTGANTFASLQGQFNAATLAARGGDQEAAKLLPQLSQSLLTAAAESARSRQELDRVRAQTAASLEATYGMVRSLAGLTPTSNAALLDAGAASQAGNASANDNAANPLAAQLEQLRSEMAGMRADMNSRMAANTSASVKTAQILDRVTAESGGDSLSVALSA